MYRSASDWYNCHIETFIIYEKYVADFESGSGYKKKEGIIKAKLKEMGLYIDGDDVRGLKKISATPKMETNEAFDFDADEHGGKSVITRVTERLSLQLGPTATMSWPEAYVCKSLVNCILY